MYGVDYAFGAHPTTSQLKAAGVKFVGRYVSPKPVNDTNGKNLTPAEYKQLRAAGFEIILFAEQYAARMREGRSSGVADAKHFDAVVKALGMTGAVMYCAADWDASTAEQPAIDAYLDGAASVIGRKRVGIYGGYHVVKRVLDAGKASYACQTYAWSGTTASYPAPAGAAKVKIGSRYFLYDKRAQVRQGTQRTIGPTACDNDTSTARDYGQFPRPSANWTYGPPRNLKVHRGRTSVKVDCDQPAGAPVKPDHYVIRVYHAGKLVATYPRTARAMPAQTGHLRPGTPYRVTVVAAGPNGTHVRPNTYASAKFTTSMPWTYGPPRNLKVTAGHTTVKVNCSPPAGAPVKPDHYVIRVYRLGKLVATYPRTARAMPAQTGHLQRHKTYRVTVVAAGPNGTRVRPNTYASAKFTTG